ncbi:MAG: hypothetical protein IT386_10730 [Deltaproteobacteria bacterium]|nr:hypothetical protein [Deltaproteobacteria bacterium]
MEYPGSSDRESERSPHPAGNGTLVVESSWQAGDMGEILDYSSDATASWASSSFDSAQIRLDSVGTGFWVMSDLSITGVDILTAPAGIYRNGGVVSTSLVLCSGRSLGNYTFDHVGTPNEVRLTDNADGSRNLTFVVSFRSWTSESQVATGSVDYRGVVVRGGTDGGAVPPIVASEAALRGSLGVDFEGPTVSEVPW